MPQLRSIVAGRAAVVVGLAALAFSSPYGLGAAGQQEMGTSAPEHRSDEDLPQLLARLAPAVGTIRCYDQRDRRIGQGTGFLIGEGRLVTNTHVVQRAHRAEVELIGERKRAVLGVIAEHSEQDLIVLAIESTDEDKDLPHIPLAKEFPRVGERVFVVGSPLGLAHTISEGLVSSIRELKEFGGRVIQTTAPISPGSSGSPLINRDGKAVGAAVAVKKFSEGQSLNFAVPVVADGGLPDVAGKEPMSLRQWRQTRRNERDAEMTHIERAERAIESRDHFAALLHSNRAIGEDPENPEAWQWYGTSLFIYGNVENIGGNDAGFWEHAVRALRRAIELDPDHGPTYANLASILASLGRHEEAVEAAREAVERVPSYFGAFVNLGSSLATLGRFEEAIDAYRKAIRIEPGALDAREYLGRVYEEAERWPQALNTYRELIRIKPDSHEGHLRLGIVYMKMDDRPAALDQYRILTRMCRKCADRLFEHIYPNAAPEEDEPEVEKDCNDGGASGE